MYKEDLALDNQKGLIYHKTKPNLFSFKISKLLCKHKFWTWFQKTKNLENDTVHPIYNIYYTSLNVHLLIRAKCYFNKYKLCSH